MGPQRLTAEEAIEYLIAVSNSFRKFPGWRSGQTLFNVLNKMYPALANAEIRAKNMDPFYQTSGFGSYFEAIFNKGALEDESVQREIKKFG